MQTPALVLRLEEIAAVQTDTAIKEGAIEFLVALGAKPILLVRKMVQSALLRLGISDGSTNGTEPPKSSISSQDDLRPVWDPTWHATPNGILLKAVQDRDQRNANVDNLPAQYMDICQEIRSSSSKSSLQDIQSALKTYYARHLSILRVSGDELDLETCYVNLAIVEAPAQREKEKQDLKEQAAVFHRIPSFEAVERANMQSSIPLEQLFNKRKL
ncbi:hypothetical protein BGZ58_002525, partial [Dissophora ornata]